MTSQHKGLCSYGNFHGNSHTHPPSKRQNGQKFRGPLIQGVNYSWHPLQPLPKAAHSPKGCKRADVSGVCCIVGCPQHTPEAPRFLDAGSWQQGQPPCTLCIMDGRHRWGPGWQQRDPGGVGWDKMSPVFGRTFPGYLGQSSPD